MVTKVKAEVTQITIKDLAKEAKKTPKLVRRILRKSLPRTLEVKGARYLFSPGSKDLEEARKALRLVVSTKEAETPKRPRQPRGSKDTQDSSQAR